MVNFLRKRTRPLQRTGLPVLGTVGGRIVIGFGLLIFILLSVAGGSAWLSREHHADLAKMEEHAAATAQLQQAKVDGTVALISLQRYIISGDEETVPFVRSTSTTR